MLSVCPAAIVDAPLERVWDVLRDPASWGGWLDLVVHRVEPAGALQGGQTIVGSSVALGIRWKVRASIEGVDERSHVLRLAVRVPLLPIVERTAITCAPLAAARTRVQYG